MTKYAYIRVSTKDQNTDRQVDAMEKIGISRTHMYIDKQSGKDFNRFAYKKMLKKLHVGDELYIKSIDRLGRNYDEIIEQWSYLTRTKEVDMIVLDFPLLDTRNQVHGLTGKFLTDLVLQVLSYVAQIERENIKQRQQEGIQVALNKGTQFGRPKTIIPKEFHQLYLLCKKRQISVREAARRAGVSNHTFSGWMHEYEKFMKRQRRSL